MADTIIPSTLGSLSRIHYYSEKKRISVKIIFTTSLIALSLILIGGLYYNSNIIFYSGISLAAADILATVAIVVTSKKIKYNVVTWNIGSNGDFTAKSEALKIRSMDITIKQDSQRWHLEVQSKRRELLMKHRDVFANVDLFCLQESENTFNPETLKQIFPNYEFIQDSKKDVIVGWNTTRFREIAKSELGFGSEGLGKGYPSQIVLLEDVVNGSTILLTSLHVAGLDLSRPEDADFPQKTIGNQQLEALETHLIKNFNPNLTIMGMDANVTWKYHSGRLREMQNRGYVFDSDKRSTTISFLDANRRIQLEGSGEFVREPVKLDHICIRSNPQFSASIRPLPSPQVLNCALTNLESPGDHAPVFAEITLRA